MNIAVFTNLATPIGPLRLVGNGRALTAIRFVVGERVRPPDLVEDRAPFREAVRQLEAYFAGRLRRFDLSLEPGGTPFQTSVWEALRAIPYGETTSYRELAIRVGRPRAVRAVGAANGRNPLPIVIPCHRVIGSDGSLTGFGGGLAVKRALLELEGALGGPLFASRSFVVSART